MFGIAVGVTLAITYGQKSPLMAPQSPNTEYVERQKQVEALLTRSRKMATRIEPSRPIYFLGEAVRAKVSIENPDVLPAEIISPRACESGIDVSVARGSQWVSMLGEPRTTVTQAGSPQTTVIGGFQKIVQDFSEMERPGCHYTFVQPQDPGRYRIRYSYGSSFAEFEVVDAILDDYRSVFIKSSGEKTGASTKDQNIGEDVKDHPQVKLATLRWREKYYLVVTRMPRIGNPLPKRGEPLGYVASMFLYPFVRVAASDLPIVSFNAAADSAQSLNVTWQTADGRKHASKLDSESLIVESTDPIP
jgi:hypothetical protein